jgi:ubiquinone biosynthesis protein
VTTVAAPEGGIGAARRLARVAGVSAGHLAAAPLRRSRSTGVLPGLLIRLGPTFVKGAQLLSTRRDMLSERTCARLAELTDRVPAMSRGQAEHALDAAYTDRGRWPFREFDWTAAASGSIACVYRAELRDGREVAVKLRRPGIGPDMRADFRIMAAGAAAVQRFPPMRKVPTTRIVRHLRDAVLGQLDFDAEAAALLSLRANFRPFGFIRVPEVLPEFCGPGALVMEYVPGLRRFAPGELTREQRRELIRRVLAGVFRMLFVDGVVHCDLHPGNLYLDPSGEIIMLDAGFVVQLDDRVRQHFARFFMNMSLGRGAECADVVLDSAEDIPPGVDLTEFRRGIVELVTEASGQTAGQFRLAPFAARLFDLQRRSGVAAAPEFIFPLMSLLVLEGMINDFDIDVDFQAEAIPVLLPVLRYR